jgi:hypothetical protein
MSAKGGSSHGDFTKYWMIGIAAGICAAAVTASLISAYLSLRFGTTPLAFFAVVILGFCFGLAFATHIAIPIAPVAALLSWPLFRFGVRQLWPYILCGALAATSAPILYFLLIASGRAQLGAEPPAAIVCTVFALCGALGASVAARAWRKDQAAEQAATADEATSSSE